MIRKITFLTLVLFHQPIKSNEGISDSPQQPNNYYTILNDNSQKTFIEKKPSKIPCGNACGEKLVECIFSLPIAEQREIFALLPASKRREYLRKLDMANYEKFLKSYSEEEWKNLLIELTDYERSHWPKTVKEQTVAMEKIKVNAEKARDYLGLGCGLALDLINPLFMTLHLYEAYHVIKYDVHPITKNFRDVEFKQYMEAVFEI